LNELQARISQILDRLATEVPPEYASFEHPVTPARAQTGTLTASPIMPCSGNRNYITTYQNEGLIFPTIL
jgi:hypothetical protein